MGGIRDWEPDLTGLGPTQGPSSGKLKTATVKIRPKDKDTIESVQSLSIQLRS